MKIIEDAQRLKYLVSLQVTVVHAGLYFSSLFLYITERSGLLKPVVKIVGRMVKSLYQQFFEGMIKSVVRLVLEKYFHVPVELLKVADGSKVMPISLYLVSFIWYIFTSKGNK